MVYSWSRGCNGILADEMGLGKTVQCAAMVGECDASSGGVLLWLMNGMGKAGCGGVGQASAVRRHGW